MDLMKIGEILIDFDGEDGSIVYRLTENLNDLILKESNKDLLGRIESNIDDLQSIIYDLLERGE
jgi:hypothetical protein